MKADEIDTREVRCSCGRLLVRLVELGIELKCGKCKTAHVVPWSRVQRAPSLRLAEVELEEARCDPRRD